mmetsp:Transcript_8425/g.31199  ORF Transcript_8425/g.31199 Transcript_8425/m.31199 type:complete len:88 (-) Transcript_8425:1403-1666(-)
MLLAVRMGRGIRFLTFLCLTDCFNVSDIIAIANLGIEFSDPIVLAVAQQFMSLEEIYEPVRTRREFHELLQDHVIKAIDKKISQKRS